MIWSFCYILILVLQSNFLSDEAIFWRINVKCLVNCDFCEAWLSPLPNLDCADNSYPSCQYFVRWHSVVRRSQGKHRRTARWFPRLPDVDSSFQTHRPIPSEACVRCSDPAPAQQIFNDRVTRSRGKHGAIARWFPGPLDVDRALQTDGAIRAEAFVRRLAPRQGHLHCPTGISRRRNCLRGMHYEEDNLRGDHDVSGRRGCHSLRTVWSQEM